MDCGFQTDAFQQDAFQMCIPVPPTLPVQVVEERRWPGPPITLYRETDVIPNWQRRREDDEILIL